MIDIDSLVKTPIQIQKIISSNFKKRRKEHKMTQKELSSRSGVSFGSLKRFEQIGEISLINLIKLAQILDLEEELLKLFTNSYYENIEDMLN